MNREHKFYPAQAEEVKEPWEITREEVDKTYLPNIPYPADGATAKLNGQPARYNKKAGRLGWTYKSNAGPEHRVTDPKTIDLLNHQVIVQQAIERGDITSHPDYPELAAETLAEAPPTEKT